MSTLISIITTLGPTTIVLRTCIVILGPTQHQLIKHVHYSKKYIYLLVEEASEAENNENITTYIALCVAIAVFIIVIVVIIIIVRRRNNHHQNMNNRDHLPNGSKYTIVMMGIHTKEKLLLI